LTLQGIRILVIDPSLRSTGFYRSDTNSGGTIDTRKLSHDGALVAIGAAVRGLLADTKADLLLLEDYSYSANSRATTALGEVRGVITFVCKEESDRPIVTVPVQTWKSKTIGRIKKGSALEKLEYMKQAQLLCRRSFESIDEADAFMIFRAADYICTYEPKHKLAEKISIALEAISQGQLI